MLSDAMPIRTALAALLLSLLFLVICPGDSRASEEAVSSRRPVAALVQPAPGDRAPAGGGAVLGPYGLIALVAAGFVPTAVLIARRKSRTAQPD